MLVQIAIQVFPARSQGDYRSAKASHEADKQTTHLTSFTDAAVRPAVRLDLHGLSSEHAAQSTSTA